MRFFTPARARALRRYAGIVSDPIYNCLSETHDYIAELLDKYSHWETAAISIGLAIYQLSINENTQQSQTECIDKYSVMSDPNNPDLNIKDLCKKAYSDEAELNPELLIGILLVPINNILTNSVKKREIFKLFDFMSESQESDTLTDQTLIDELSEIINSKEAALTLARKSFGFNVLGIIILLSLIGSSSQNLLITECCAYVILAALQHSVFNSEFDKIINKLQSIKSRIPGDNLGLATMQHSTLHRPNSPTHQPRSAQIAPTGQSGSS